MSGENGIFNDVKNYFNVLSVCRRGEMPVQLLALVLSYRIEHAHQILLHIQQLASVTLEVGEMVADRLVLDLFDEQIRLVEEEDHGDTAETSVVDNRVEDVYALHDPVGHAVLK